jgi:hypothetical protein
MASVRATTVSERAYLQAVEYVNVDGKRKIQVLKSFGLDNLQNRLQAEQFVSNYNTFRSIAQREAQQPNVNLSDLLTGALVVFGIILGAKIISDIINELSRPSN